MNKHSKKVFVMNNLNSRYIEQAIFILKDKESKLNDAVITEAEKIVSRYLAGEENKKSAAKSGTVFIIFAAVMAVLLAIYAAVKII